MLSAGAILRKNISRKHWRTAEERHYMRKKMQVRGRVIGEKERKKIAWRGSILCEQESDPESINV